MWWPLVVDTRRKEKRRDRGVFLTLWSICFLLEHAGGEQSSWRHWQPPPHRMAFCLTRWQGTSFPLLTGSWCLASILKNQCFYLDSNILSRLCHLFPEALWVWRHARFHVNKDDFALEVPLSFQCPWGRKQWWFTIRVVSDPVALVADKEGQIPDTVIPTSLNHLSSVSWSPCFLS